MKEKRGAWRDSGYLRVGRVGVAAGGGWLAGAP